LTLSSNQILEGFMMEAGIDLLDGGFCDLPDSKASGNESHPQTRLHDLLRGYELLLGD
jgi:hypothetical protein